MNVLLGLPVCSLGSKWLKASNSVKLEWILKGVPNISFHLNVSLFGCVQSYMLEAASFWSVPFDPKLILCKFSQPFKKTVIE